MGFVVLLSMRISCCGLATAFGRFSAVSSRRALYFCAVLPDWLFWNF